MKTSAVGAAAVALTLCLGPAAAHASFPGRNGKIAFDRLDPVGGISLSIWTIDPDGSHPKQLTGRLPGGLNTPSAFSDFTPSWSADGRRIAFTSDRNGYYDIYVMDADGKHQTLLTSNLAVNDLVPAWSPNGRKIAFMSNRDDREHGNDDIYAMDADGSHAKRLTTNPEDDAFPTWAPDGTRIAFVGVRGGRVEIHVMNADGTGEHNLTRSSGYESRPSWSPDARRIAFETYREQPQPHYEIHVMRADGSHRRELTSGSADDYSPSWSPNGARIAFRPVLGAYFDIATMRTDGSDQVLLTSRNYDYDPDWQPAVESNDVTPPQTTITIGPGRFTQSRRARFGFVSSDARSTFQCKLDGGAFRACESPRVYSRLAVGSHRFAVRATDAARNVDGTPAVRTWRVTTG